MPSRIRSQDKEAARQEELAKHLKGQGARISGIRGSWPFLAPRLWRSVFFTSGPFLLALFLALSAPASELSVITGAPLPQPGLRGGATGGPRIGVKVKSLHEMRWQNVVRQQLDIGCGAAALATILTYYFDFPTTEEEMFHPLMNEALKRAGPDVTQVGFNLRHIRDVAAKGGVVAGAFRVAPRALHKIRIPAIARITLLGYDHFVVFREARHGRVYVADPSFGNTSYTLPAFTKIWSGVIMGFTRRTGGRPTGHFLEVGPQDQRMVSFDEIMRLASTERLAPSPDTGPQFFNISTFPFVQPRITGLRSVFPFFLGNRIEF